MEVFGWIMLIIFMLLGLSVVLYAVCTFAIVHIRLFGIKLSGELELMREDYKKSKELKRNRLATMRDAKHKIEMEKFNTRIERAQKAEAEKQSQPTTEE